MFKHRPEELFGQVGRTDFVGVGEIVPARRLGSAQAGQWAGMETERVTNIIQPDGMRELGKEQSDRMTPRSIGSALVLDSRFPG